MICQQIREMMTTSVHMISLGCARNDVDSEELAGRLEAGGFHLVDRPEDAQVIMVNTCGFIEQAKKDSIDTLLAAADYKKDKAQAVVAVGCMAQRYGQELADALPEADAVLGFDSYRDIAATLQKIVDEGSLPSHTPHDRRKLLPLAPIERPQAASAVPGHSIMRDLVAEKHLSDLAAPSGPRPLRKRLDNSPFAPLKIASGCDRRCGFCAIPSFRGSYLSRPIDEVVAEARWLVTQGVSEVMLVSENSSSYGKDFADRDALSHLLKALNDVDGLTWIRVSYLQPAEIRPSLLDAMARYDKVVPYYDLSFQHASASVLKKMRRFGDAEHFLGLIEKIRKERPDAGFRTNVIVGYPGEKDRDVEILSDFITEAMLDIVGVFSYSDEEGTYAATLDDHLDPETIQMRHEQIASIAEHMCNERAAERIGTRVKVLVESNEDGIYTGRSAHQGPEVDGVTILDLERNASYSVGDYCDAIIVDTEGIDLIAQPLQQTGA